MQIKQRLKINVAVSVTAALIILLALSLAMYRVNLAMEASDIADDIVKGTFERNTFRQDYLQTNSERARIQWFAKHEQIGGLLKAALAKLPDAEDRRIVDELLKDHQSTGKLFSAVVENRDKSGLDAGRAALSQEIEDRLNTQMNMGLYNRILHIGKLHESARGNLFSALRLAGWCIFSALAIIIAAVLINSWTMGRTITDRIVRLGEGALRIGGGDLEYRIDIKGDDEFAELSGAFDEMTGKLGGFYNALEKEIEERKWAEEMLRKAHNELELRVQERTKELNEAAKSIKTERQRFFDVLEMLPVYVVLLTPDYHVPFANRFFRERFGESGGKRCYEYLFNRTEPCEICETYSVFKTTAPHHWEWTGPDGRNYDIFDFPFTDTDGSPLIMEVGIDITERKHAEKALREINQTLERRVAERSGELQAANTSLSDSRRAALNLMEDSVAAHRKAEEANAELRQEVIERKRAEDRILYQNTVLDGISRILREALTAVTEGELGRACLTIAEEVTQSKFGFIDEFNPATGKLDVIAISDPGWNLCRMEDKTGHGKAPISVNIHGIYGKVFLDGKPLLTNDPSSHPDSIGIPEGHPPLTAFLGVPLIHGGKAIGMIGLGNREGGYRTADVKTMEALAHAIVQTLLRKRAEESLRRAHHELEDRVKERTEELAVSIEALQDEIADRRKAEEALRESQMILAKAQSVAGIGSWSYDLRSKKVTWSDELYRIAGMTPGVMNGDFEKIIMRLVHNDDREKVRTAYEQMLAALKSDPLEYRIILPDGDSRVVWADADIILDAPGKPVSIVGTVQDITERKRAEEELSRLATAVESAADALVVTDPINGIIQYVNPAFEKITGYSRDEVVGRDLHMLDCGKYDQAFYRSLRETLRQDGFWTGRLVHKKKDGSLYEEECTYSTVKNESGETINYISIKRDVTEKARLESIAQAVETMNNIGYIFSGVSHEIGNPINAINMTLNNMKSRLGGLSKEKLAEYIDNLIMHGARVAYLVKTLKTFNMFENLNPRNIEVREFLETFVSMVRKDFETKGIVIDSAVDTGMQSLYADPRALQQVLLNVLTNAADALEGCENPKITVSISGSGGLGLLRVQDNGCGIEENRLKDIFKPFYTTKVTGTGLGLVIIKKMIAKMNGTIEIKSLRNEGTVVEISLPSAKNGGTDRRGYQ